MLVCIVSIEAKVGMRNDLAKLIANCALESRKEKGCVCYELYVAEDNDSKAVLKEAWKDRGALEAHFKTEHYHELMEKSKGMRVKPDDVQIFEMDEQRLKNVMEDKSSLMETIYSIESRRSLRRFTDKPISERDVKTILRAGLCAPSAQNKRPYHFVVVDDKTILDEISSFNPHWKLLQGARICIVVCGDKNVQSIPEFLYEDCAAATQNILLCVHGLYLGGVWCGISTVTPGFEAITEKLGLTSSVIPVSIVAIGHPAEERDARDRFEEKKVHLNGFSEVRGQL